MKEDKQRIIQSFKLPIIALAVMWLIKLFELISSHSVAFLGIRPREWAGLTGILFAPFIHGDVWHLLSNTWPLLFLGAFLIYYYKSIYWRVILLIYVFGGLRVWIAARSSTHIGASGVIYGLAFFLFFSGLFRNDLRALALSLIVAFLYGGMIWGLFASDPGISWESHLFGAIVGVICAFWYRKVDVPPKDTRFDHEIDDPVEYWNYKKHFPPPEGFQYPEEK